MVDFPGEKLIIKMWETLTEKGVGGLLRPWQIRREGRTTTDVRKEELLVSPKQRTMPKKSGLPKAAELGE